MFTVDHHRGSEENQPGWDYHDPTLVDPEVGRIDTLAHFRRTIAAAGLEDEVVAVVGRVHDGLRALAHAAVVAVRRRRAHRRARRERLRRLRPLGRPRRARMVIHDVFPDPADGGQPPYRVYLRALESGDFVEVGRARVDAGPRRVRGEAGDPVR